MSLKKDPRKTSGLSHISEILKGVFREDLIPKHLNEEFQIFGSWQSAVGAEISRKAIPKWFKNGILFVETDHPVWTTELQTKSHQIKKKLNELIGKEIVREIQFRQKRL